MTQAERTGSTGLQHPKSQAKIRSEREMETRSLLDLYVQLEKQINRQYVTKANVNKLSTIKKIHVLSGYLCGRGHKEGNTLSSFA